MIQIRSHSTKTKGWTSSSPIKPNALIPLVNLHKTTDKRRKKLKTNRLTTNSIIVIKLNKL